MEKKKSELIPLSQVLEQCVIGKQQPILSLLDLMKRWQDIVGPLIAENVSPVRLARRSLMLRAASPIWAQELQLMTPRLLEEIRTHCPHLQIERIRFIS